MIEVLIIFIGRFYSGPDVVSKDRELAPRLVTDSCVGLTSTVINSEFCSPDGEEEAGEQDEEGPAERRVPGAARQAEALLQDRQRL